MLTKISANDARLYQKGSDPFLIVFMIFALGAAPTAHALLKVDQVTMGEEHTCALTNDGKVKCWGNNTDGQLGDGTTSLRPLPTPVQGLPAAAASVSAGDFHTCALLVNGQVWCWGRGIQGQLGNGAYDNQKLPVQVQGLEQKVRMMSVGGLSSCVVLVDNTVRCWGQGYEGQLGNGNLGKSAVPSSPRFPPGAAGVSRVIVCVDTVFSIHSDGSLWSWGDNYKFKASSQNVPEVIFPQKLSDMPGSVVDLSSGRGHTCAVLNEGSIWCWGYNQQFQLATGDSSDWALPVQVKGLGQGVHMVSAFNDSTCALLNDGAMACWGDNIYGKLGLGSPDYNTTGKPGFLKNLTAVAGLGHGPYANHLCAVFSNGLLKCWGNNTYGQLGYGDFVHRGSAENIDDIEIVDVSR